MRWVNYKISEKGMGGGGGVALHTNNDAQYKAQLANSCKENDNNQL